MWDRAAVWASLWQQEMRCKQPFLRDAHLGNASWKAKDIEKPEKEPQCSGNVSVQEHT